MIHIIHKTHFCCDSYIFFSISPLFSSTCFMCFCRVSVLAGLFLRCNAFDLSGPPYLGDLCVM